MTPVSISDVLAATRGRGIDIHDARLEVQRIENDSRQVRPGDLFWALKGDRHDGHDYIDQARRQGAAACIVERNNTSGKGPLIEVNDTLPALWDFAAWYRQQLDTLVIGVTGSVGKTTTRHMLACTLSESFRGIESPRNYNNHIGVPLSVAEINADHEFAVLEFGASRVGEIAQLARIAQPEIGLVTAIGPAHLEDFGSIENICRAKRELVQSLPESGFAVLNGDDDRVRGLAQGVACRVLFVGESPNNHCVVEDVEQTNDRLQFRIDGSRFGVRAAGRHHVMPAAMAVAVGREVGMRDAEIAAGLSRFEPVAGRCSVQRIGPWTVIDDTYNANPKSMRAACELLRSWRGAGRRVAVLGDMLALGAASEAHHRRLGEYAAGHGIDRIVAVGAQAAAIARSAKQAGMDAGCLGACRDLDTLMVLLDCWLEPGDVVLVKGSRGMHMEQVIERLRQQCHDATRPPRLKDVA